MSAFSIFVRSLDGRCKMYEVTDETPIEFLHQQWNAETMPDFYEVHLYHDNIELGAGTVRNEGLTQGSELSAVVSGPTQNKHVQTIIRLRAANLEEEEDCGYPAAARCAAAVTFLGDYFDAWETATIDALHAILLDEPRLMNYGTRYYEPICFAVGEVFGRICDPAIQYIPSLIACLPCDASIMALDEIDARGEFPLEQKKILLCRVGGRGFPFIDYDSHETMLAQTRLVRGMPDANLRQMYRVYLEREVYIEDDGPNSMREHYDILGLWQLPDSPG
jgi:hypothetical protein